MPAFYIMLFVFVFFCLLCASFLYKPIGRYIRGLFRDVKQKIDDEDDDKKGEEKE